MSFLEELAQSTIEKEQAEQAMKAQARALEKLRQQQERVRHEPNEERRQLALLYRQTSGIGLLVKRLGQILAFEQVTFRYPLWGQRSRSSGIGSLIKTEIYNDPYPDQEDKVSRGISKGPDYDIVADGNNDKKHPLKYPEIQPQDVNGTLDIAIWDTVYTGRGRTNSHNGVYREYSEYRIKYLAAESSPDGFVTFIGGNLEPVPEQIWRTQPGFLEKCLKTAFTHPKTHSFKDGFHKFKGYVPNYDNREHYSPHGRGPWS